METFIKPRELVCNPRFKEQKQKSTDSLSVSMIDAPITELVTGLNELAYCFTLQCCYGHFLYEGQDDPNNLDSLPFMETLSKVEYRIAYIAFCIENSESGKMFMKSLRDITHIDTENIQFCSAAWFWERQVNSYVLQVEPNRFKHADRAIIEYKEALHIEKLRNEFFHRIEDLVC